MLASFDIQTRDNIRRYQCDNPIIYYSVIALILVDIVPSWDIEGRELASVRRYPNEGQYYRVIALISANIVPSLDIEGTIFADISAITLLLYSYKYFK